MLVAGSVVLSGCLFSSGSPPSKPAGGGAVSPSATTAVGAATVPPALIPGQPAPTVSASEAEKAQLAVAAATTIPSAAPEALAPITSLLPTASRGLLTPEAAKRNLWDSWQDKDRERAALYAAPAAVSSLFALPWTPETVDQGCQNSIASGIAAVCLFLQGTTVKVLQITGSDATGYKVTKVTNAQQQLPPVVILPNPTGPGGSTVPGVAIDENGNLITPTESALTVATVAGAGGSPGSPGASGSLGSKGRRAKPATTKPKTVTNTTAPASSADAPVADAPPPASVAPPAGVPAGAPVVNVVEG